MTIGELVFWYACVFLVLLLALIALLLRQKSSGKKLSLQLEWRAMVVRFKENAPRGDSWLKIFVAGFTALAAGVIIAIFVLPYGTAAALAALAITVAALVFYVPRLLA